jgi:hypothetical protein
MGSGGWLVCKEAIDPDSIEGFGYVKEYRACPPLFAELPGDSFDESR